MVRIMNFQPAFMDLHIVDGKASVDHFLNEVCEIQFGDILRLLKSAGKIADHIAIGFEKLLSTGFAESGKTYELVGCGFRIYLVANICHHIFTDETNLPAGRLVLVRRASIGQCQPQVRWRFRSGVFGPFPKPA